VFSDDRITNSKDMLAEFKDLSNDETELMIKAPLLVSILIAGADGEVDRSEIRGALSTLVRKAKSNASLRSYLENVSEDFEDKLKALIQGYPFNAEERTEMITNELSGLNDIFKKIDGKLSGEIYKSLKALALNIAKSSGGIFGIKSIGSEEAKHLDLSMITPPAKK